MGLHLIADHCYARAIWLLISVHSGTSNEESSCREPSFSCDLHSTCQHITGSPHGGESGGRWSSRQLG